MKARRTSRRRQGFTLLELMIALLIGGLVVAAVFTLGGASTRHFHEQQRVGVTQRSVRMAMDRLRRDIARAGYLSVPDTRSPNVRMCPTPTTPRVVQAVWFDDADTAGNAALDTVNRTQNAVSADRLRLTGNYATSDGYLVRALNGDGTQVTLQTDWLAFRRSFVSNLSGTPTVDTARYAEVFRPGRMLHIETANGFHFLVEITASSVNSLGSMATITISPGLGADNPCLRGLGRGSIATPISEIEYFIGTPGTNSSLLPRNEAVTGANTVLFRRELNMGTGDELAGSRRPILEWAVDFNLEFVVDTSTSAALPPVLQRRNGATAETVLQNSSWQVRSVIASLAGRTPEQDRRFPWPTEWAGGRPSSAPLNRFLVFPDQPGAARVRRLTTEIQAPNLIPR